MRMQHEHEIGYVVRVSLRAKRVILRLRPHAGLEVVVPAGFDQDAVPGIVRSKADWVRRTLERMRTRSLGPDAQPTAPARDVLPREVYLRAVDRSYTVHRGVGSVKSGPRLAQNGAGALVFTGDAGDAAVCVALLRGWLLEQGKRSLTPWLREVGRELDLACDAVRIRAQRTRWGSCTSRGGVSLNCRLLFLPPELVRYVLVHELCHTAHLNHGPKFWKLVGQYEPACRILDKRLNQAWRYVPAWAD